MIFKNKLVCKMLSKIYHILYTGFHCRPKNTIFHKLYNWFTFDKYAAKTGRKVSCGLYDLSYKDMKYRYRRMRRHMINRRIEIDRILEERSKNKGKD